MTPSLTLARFLTLFLVRRVLRRGALQVPLVRWTLLVVIVMAVVALFAFGVVTLRQLIVDPEMLRPLLRVAGAAVPLWVVALFTLVRILFLKSGDLVELTYCLPITNRARMLGFMLFEALLVGGGLALILGALICGSLSIGGPGVLDDIATCLLMPAVVAYLLASAYYLALERMLMRLRLARLRSFLVPIVLAATLVALYAWVSSQSEAVLFASVGQGTHFACRWCSPISPRRRGCSSRHSAGSPRSSSPRRSCSSSIRARSSRRDASPPPRGSWAARSSAPTSTPTCGPSRP